MSTVDVNGKLRLGRAGSCEGCGVTVRSEKWIKTNQGLWHRECYLANLKAIDELVAQLSLH